MSWLNELLYKHLDDYVSYSLILNLLPKSKIYQDWNQFLILEVVCDLI